MSTLADAVYRRKFSVRRPSTSSSVWVRVGGCSTKVSRPSGPAVVSLRAARSPVRFSASLDRRAHRSLGRLVHCGDARFGVEVLEVARHRAALGVDGHRARVGVDRGKGGILHDGVLPVGRLSTDDDARDEALEIPLPRRPGGLVEVVEVEHERALRRGVEAEVRHVRVAAGCDQDAAVRLAGEVRSLDRGGAAVERERTRRHPLDPQGDQVGHAQSVLRVEDAERVAVGRGQPRKRAAGDRPPRVSAFGHALRDRLGAGPRLRERCIRHGPHHATAAVGRGGRGLAPSG